MFTLATSCTPRTSSRTSVQNWLVAICALLSLVFLLPSNHPMPAAAGGVFTFALVQVLFRNCRPSRVTPLCPWNWALLIFGFKLVLLPISEIVGGVSIGELPHLPSDANINLALLLDALAFLSLAFAYDWAQSWLQQRSWTHTPRALAWSPPVWLVMAYLAVGLAGVGLFFGDPRSLVSYFREPAGYFLAQQQASEARLDAVASIFLRPFLGFAFVLMLCRLLDARRRWPNFYLWAGVTLLVVATGLSFSVFSYNRGALAASMLAVCSVLLSRVRRHAWRLVGSVALVSTVLLSVSTIYRTTHGATDLASSFQEWQSAGGEVDVAALVQVYGNGPQFLGFLLEETDWSEMQLGRGLVSAAMSPVPWLGKDFRSSSGTAFYNRLLNRGNAEDQVISFAGELFLNFHVIGIVAGFAVMGVLLAKLQDAFVRSQSAMPIYVIQLTAIWLLFLVVGSLSVVAQIAIYFYWPVYLYLLLRTATGSRRNAVALRPAFQGFAP
jgi:hypothetical protein